MIPVKKKILVVDDDVGMIRLLEKWLTVAGREMLWATKGQEGFKKAVEKQPDLILLDLMLPDIGGQEVARRLKADPQTRDIPIIFMTVVLGVENDKGNEELEVDGIRYRAFAKPLHSRKLLSEIRKAINRREHNKKS